MRGCCIFSGSSHPRLVESICDRLGQKPANVALKKFSNGETSVEIQTSVRDQDVFIVQSGSSQINDNVMEMLIMISACKGGSAKSITAVMPYFPYSRQSKKKTHRGAITARMLASLMRVAGVDHVITIDLHASQMQGFFKCPVDNLIAEPLIARWIKLNIPDWQESVVVSKNPGGTKRVTSLADALKLSFGIVTTDRLRSNRVPSSMQASAILEPIGTDGTNEHDQLEEEREIQEGWNPPKELNPPRGRPRTNSDKNRARFANHRATPVKTSSIRSRMMNGNVELASSPLSRSTKADSTASSGDDSGSQRPKLYRRKMRQMPLHRDEDGYEEPDDGNETDERTSEVVTGRLLHGHIVDDDVPSPQSNQSSNNNGQRSSSEEDLPDHMMRSFISTTSSRMKAPIQGLGGAGDTNASEEEEEEDLQNPEIETTVTLVGNVRDKPVLIIDDMIDKPGSWIAAAETVVKRGGATGVYAIATHGLFGGDCLRQLDACPQIEKIVVTDAFPIPDEKRRGVRKLVVLDVSNLLSEAIRRNHHGESISQLYQMLD